MCAPIADVIDSFSETRLDFKAITSWGECLERHFKPKKEDTVILEIQCTYYELALADWTQAV